MSDHEPAASSRTLPEPEDFPERGPNALGSFGHRAAARILDELLISVPFWIAVGVLVGEGADDTRSGAVLALFAVTIAVQSAYEIGCVARWGQTLGKRLFGLRVVRYTDGGAPTLSQSALRAMLPITADAAVAALAVSVWAAAVVYASSFLSPLRRGWHDAAGGTLVVRTR